MWISRTELRQIIREEVRDLLVEELYSALHTFELSSISDRLSSIGSKIDDIHSLIVLKIPPDVIPYEDFHDRYDKWKQNKDS